MGAAGSALLALPLMFVTACTGTASICGNGENADVNFCAVMTFTLLELLFIAISGAAGYDIVDREGNPMTSDQALASTAVGEAALITFIALVIAGTTILTKMCTVEFSGFKAATQEKCSVEVKTTPPSVSPLTSV